MTLRELIAAHPDKFYPQTWYEGHEFAERKEGKPLPPDVLSVGLARGLVHAVDLARLYTKTPADERWRYFVWTDDRDDFGNRVYVGGIGRYDCEGFQIHRLLEPSPAIMKELRL